MKTHWYKDAVIYQIYPRSFFDSNGDGIGDINGITQKIDYLKELGVDAVWLSPCYKSPNDDNGYDISDYRDIMDEFGTFSDWKRMLDAFHSKGIKVIMDLVVNHTSDEHKWFQESRKSKNNPYSDYYIWRDGKGKNGKTPPNKWKACFGGSAWEYDDNRKQFYLHLFSKKQPDLNWENPKVRKEVADICNFWLKNGVDGFRCDVITYISKPDNLYDASQNEIVVGPHWKEYIKELSAASFNDYDTAIIGEAAGIDFNRAAEITREGENLLDMLFHFEHVAERPVCAYNQKSTNLKWFKNILFKWQKLPASSWGAVYYENHDQARSIPRFAPSEEHRDKAAKSLALSLLFQKGTPFLYQGQEIGMTNCSFKREDYRDIQSVNRINDALKLPFGKLIAYFAEKHLQHYARDNARTPMQWSNEKNGGFTIGRPWMKVNENYKQINVQNQIDDESSVLSFYKKAIALRKEYSKIIRDGDFIPVNKKDKNVLAFARTAGDKTLLVLCSLSPKAVYFLIPEQYYGKDAKLLLSNNINGIKLERKIKLNPCDCAVWEI